MTHEGSAGPGLAEVDLKPSNCPLCGGVAYATRTVNGTQMFKVGCASCGLGLKAAWYRGELQPTKDLLTLWNTRSALRAATAPQDGWQPIETAPKDGRCVLVLADDGERFVACWKRGGWELFGAYARIHPVFRWHTLPAAP